MPLAPNLATLVAVGNGHLLEYIFPYLGCCDQLSLFSMARFIHIEARPVLLREPWIAFHCAVCSEVKRRFYDRCIRRAPKAFGWSWFLRHALHDGDSLGRDVVATVRVYALVARPFFRSLPRRCPSRPANVLEAFAKSGRLDHITPARRMTLERLLADV